MKIPKLFLASMALLYGTSAVAQSGDFSINVQMLPATCSLGDTVVYDIQVITDPNGGYVYPINCFTATIQAPGDGKIIGFTDDGASAGWQITRFTPNTNYPNGGGNSVTIRNTVPFGVYTESYPSLKVVATSLGTAVGNQTAANILRNIGFGGIPDLDPNNNSSGTSLEVIPGTSTPLHFLGINAAWKNNDGIVKWIVADETENDYFSIQRSFDGKKFEDVGKVKSIGNHKDVYTYSFDDVNVKTQTTDNVFYRVKQVDISGRSTSTTIVKLSTAASGDEAYIFPNPVKGDRFSLVYQNANIKDATSLNIQILDAHGRLIQETNAAISNGKNQIELSTQGLAAGTYFLNYVNKVNNIKGSIRVLKD